MLPFHNMIALFPTSNIFKKKKKKSQSILTSNPSLLMSQSGVGFMSHSHKSKEMTMQFLYIRLIILA